MKINKKPVSEFEYHIILNKDELNALLDDTIEYYYDSQQYLDRKRMFKRFYEELLHAEDLSVESQP